MQRKIVAVIIGLMIVIGHLPGIFPIDMDGIVIVASAIEYEPDANTVGLWHFNEGSEQYANDSSGNNNNGILSPGYPSDSPQWWIYGRLWEALEFDGSNDYVYVPHSDSLNITDEITMEAWVKPYSFATIPYILFKPKTSGSALYALIITSDGKPKAFFDTPNHITAVNPIPINEWTHIVATFDGSIKRIYINGIENKNEPYSHTVPTSTKPINIGRAGIGDHFDGIMDEVRLSNVARTSQEILDHYSMSLLYVDDDYTGSEPDFGILRFKVIQNAIDSASSGDTVFVYEGTYNEKVLVDKKLILIGENRDTTVIDGGGGGVVVSVTADYVDISGFKIINGDYGVRLQYDNNRVSNCIVLNHLYFGISCTFSDNNVIRDNNVSYNGGVSITGASIAMYACRGNTIINNTMWDNGIHIDGENPEYWNSHTIDPSNTVNGKPVYYWKNTIGGIVPFGAGQVILGDCENVTVEKQNIDNSTSGILMGFSDGNFIYNNTISNTRFGVRIFRCNENIFNNNTVFDSEEDCIWLYYSDRNVFRDCEIKTGTLHGFKLSTSTSANTFENNTIMNNGWGIYIDSGSNANKIFHNRFLSNTNQADDSGVNQWDNGYPTGGNYWSDYSGADDFKGPNQDIPGMDEIGDTNYTIDSDSVDNYPLISPYRFLKNITVLKQGWNLISIPLIQNEENLTRVLGSIDSYYDAVQCYDITDAADHWKHNKINKFFGNDLFELNETMSFWIHLTQPGDTIFQYNGTQPSVNQTIPLHPGWNMVGYPSLSTHNRINGLNNLTFDTHVDCIQWFDAATKTWHFMDPDDNFVPGRGYWVHSKVEAEWEVPL
jgi:parallel beta-helix repeat protein